MLALRDFNQVEVVLVGIIANRFTVYFWRWYYCRYAVYDWERCIHLAWEIMVHCFEQWDEVKVEPL